MKALSIRQPWAWLIVHGYKPVENRKWQTSYRGPLLIHASKTVDVAAFSWVRAVFPMIPLPGQLSLTRGALVGVADLVDVVDEQNVLWTANLWFQGPHGLVLTAPRAFQGSVAWRGQLGLFDVELSLDDVREW